MKKLFLQSGKLCVGEFPADVIPEPMHAGGKLAARSQREVDDYNAAVSAAKASAVEVVDFKDSDIFFEEGKLYDIREGWTVEIEKCKEWCGGAGCVPFLPNKERCSGPPRQFASARLAPISEDMFFTCGPKKAPLKEQSSGIAATGVPEPDYTNFTPEPEKGAGDDYPVIPEGSEKPVRVTFGLQPEHIALIEERAAKYGGLRSDWLWKDVGEKIGWHPHAACSYFADYLLDKLKSVSPPPQAESKNPLTTDDLWEA